MSTLREHFTEECGTCSGTGESECSCFDDGDLEAGHRRDCSTCPDCTDGRVLRDGVVKEVRATPGEFKRFEHAYSFPAEWIEADNGDS